MYSIFDDTIWYPKNLPLKKRKGHPRANDEQKKIAFNHRVTKRRAKNKASRKARKEQRK